MSGQIPVIKPTSLVVVWAFDRDDEGELVAAFEPREMQSEDRAVTAAKLISMRHPGVIAWSRAARPETGEFGEPKVLFQQGEVPELD